MAELVPSDSFGGMRKEGGREGRDGADKPGKDIDS